MYYTEDEATRKECHSSQRTSFGGSIQGKLERKVFTDDSQYSYKIVSDNIVLNIPSFNYPKNCIGSKCMLWRWLLTSPEVNKKGFCGLHVGRDND